MSQITCNCRPRWSRGWQTCDLRLSFLLVMVCILFFCSTVPESGNFVSRSGQKVGAFRLEGRKLSIIYICWYLIYVFPHTGPKVPHSRPAPKRKYVIFGLDVRKNSIRSTGVKLASPQLVFATLAFGSSVNSHELWTVQVFSSRSNYLKTWP